MDRQQILLAKSLQAAQIPLNVDSFDQRLILQKAVYLLQTAGIHIGYRFRWYLRGPYSPEMTAGVFGIINEGEFGENVLQGWQLDPDSETRANSLRGLLHHSDESESAQARRLELLASALFLFKTGQASPDDPEKTSLILKKNEKDFNSDEVCAAVKELTQYGLVSEVESSRQR